MATLLRVLMDSTATICGEQLSAGTTHPFLQILFYLPSDAVDWGGGMSVVLQCSVSSNGSGRLRNAPRYHWLGWFSFGNFLVTRSSL